MIDQIMIGGVTRRTLLGGIAAAGTAPQLRAAAPGASVDPSRVIVRMIERGQARDAAFRTAFPFGTADGLSPYVVSARHGAFLDIKAEPAERAARIDRETSAMRAEFARGAGLPSSAINQAVAAQTATLPAGPDVVREAMLRQIAALRAGRPSDAREPGIWRLPGGTDYYRLRLRCATGSDLSPAEVGRQVGAEIAALSARADRLLRQAGLNRGSVGGRLRILKARTPLYGNDDAGRQAAVADMSRALDRLRPQLPQWFNPPFAEQSTVRRMSLTDERSAKRGYRDPATASAPGVYFPDLSVVRERPAWTLTTVAYHETIPGHLLQMGRQAAVVPPPSPLQVRYAPGYAEGWAMYAESLADRIGLLSPIEQIGFIQSWLFRLARVRADIGIHVHRWSRAQAINFLEETIGFELFFPFAVEVDRYIIEPASFAADALVALALRDMAPHTPMAARAFHDRVLDQGPVSIEALGELGGSRRGHFER